MRNLHGHLDQLQLATVPEEHDSEHVTINGEKYQVLDLVCNGSSKKHGRVREGDSGIVGRL